MINLTPAVVLGVSLVLSSCATVPSRVSSMTKTIERLEPRPNGMFRIEITDPGEYFSAAVLIQGGKGKIKIHDGGVEAGRRNFLIHHRDQFARKGLLIAVADAPKDRYGQKGMLEGRFRLTEEHAKDIAAVISQLRKRTDKPVWLIGTSRGSISAVNAASRLASSANADGLVLTASVVKEMAKGKPNVFDVKLDEIAVPVLVAHHKEDACPSSPFDQAEQLKDAFTSSPQVGFEAYQGGSKGPQDYRCNRLSHHGFLGIEETVIDGIVSWVKRHSK